MSIPSSQLELAIKNTSFTLAQTQPTIRSAYQVIAPAYGVVISETTIGNTVAMFSKFEARDGLAWKEAKSWFASVRAWHEARETLGGYSQHDADLVLANWTITPDGDAWTISHPVCGTFAGVTLPLDNGRPTLLGRLIATVARVLPPSTWGFAESNNDDELTVHCIQVQGATSYNVYADQGNGQFALLGSVPDHTSRSITVAADYYNVRIAPVADSTIGILANAVQVQVGGEIVAAAGDSAPMTTKAVSSLETVTATNEQDTKPTLWERTKALFTGESE